MKKIISLLGAGAILLSVAMPAFAGCWRGYCANNDVAVVNNSATAVANTGNNSQSNYAFADYWSNANTTGASGNRYINTGAADADAVAVVAANTDVSCGCYRFPCECWESDVAIVTNSAGAGAFTGANYQDNVANSYYSSNASVNGGAGARTVYTGGADANADAWVVVNTDISSWYLFR